MTAKSLRPLALYIHVPFCRARCLYCAFPSRAAGPVTQTGYIENLSGEIEKYFETNPGWLVNTVYIGGGTPTVMSSADIKTLMAVVTRIAPDAQEITIEANPHADDLAKIPTLRSSGANRISIGVQSFDDTELGIAGRLHSSVDAHRFLETCREAGFDNISLDLIYGLPNQTIESFQKTLKEAIRFNPEHISLYGLAFESDSRLGRLPERQIHGLGLPDGDRQAEMYDLARLMLKESGYNQYEISNFARPGFECRHNIAYWVGDNYIGFGPGAASYIDGARFKRISNVDVYIATISQGKNTVEYLENLSTHRAAAEALIMGMRLSGGIDRNVIETRFGIKVTDLCGEALEKYRVAGLVEMSEDMIKLTDSAYFVSNAIFRDIIA
jgi:oxygen-independent coproporphyrinogen III oxidase